MKSMGAMAYGDKQNKMKVGLSINESGNLMNNIKMRLVFGFNDVKNDIKYKTEIDLLKKVAEITQSNVEYA